MPRHVRKGDMVIVTAGDLRGQTGVVTRVIPDKDRVVVQGLNLRTKNLKPNRINPQGGVVTIEAPIHISNVSPLVDGRATRVRFEVRDDGSKARVAARGGKELGVIHGPRDASAGGASGGSSGSGGAAPKPAKKKTAKKIATKAAPAAGAGATKKTTKKAASKKRSTKSES